MLALFSQTAPPPALALDVFLKDNWRIVLPLALGFVGVYLLLPRVRRANQIVAGGLAGIGLVLGGLWWTHQETIWIEQILFYAFSGLAILGAGLMLCQTNPVHAALAFALVVLSSCGLFLILAAPFLMAATLIIYAGAIVVTFLFVIMLAQQAGLSSADVRTREPFLATVAGFVLLGTLLVVLERGYQTKDIDPVLEKLSQLAEVKTKDDVVKLLGEPQKNLEGEFSMAFEKEVRKAIPGLKPTVTRDNTKDLAAALAVDDLEAAWVKLDAAGVRKAAGTLLEHGKIQRQWKGSLPAEKGTPALLERKPLPAQNVAALGKTLFTDFLIPIEMAGVLLLVATIGAIVIAGRRSEGLR